MWIYDLETLRFMMINAAAIAHYGYSEAEFLSMDIHAIRPPEERQRLADLLETIRADGREMLGVWTHLKKDGSAISVEVSSHAVMLEGRRCRFVFAHDVTEQLRIEAALFKSEEMHRCLINSMPHQVFWKDLDLRYVGCNKVFSDAAFMASPEDVVGLNDFDFPWAHSAERIIREDRAIIETGIPILSCEDQLLGPDGTLHWYVISKLPLYDANGKTMGVLGTIEDITKIKHAEIAQRLQARAIDASVNAIVITTHTAAGNIIEYANPAFTRISGYQPSEVIGHDCRLLQGTDTKQEGLTALRTALSQQLEATVVLRNYRKDGTLFWNQLHVAPVSDTKGNVTHYVGVLNDITNSMQYQAQLEHQANHDALTKLPNRNLFNDRLEQAIVYAKRYQHSIWVVFVDLDNFKLVNDSLGHDIGDRLLQTVASRLTNCLRKSDTVARLGGDEFMLLLIDHSDAQLSPRIVNAVLAAVASPVLLDAHELTLTCSVGVSVYPKDGDNGQLLLKNADIAMYRAKDAGRNQLQFYTSEMNARITERTLIENHLRYAVARNELLLHYQPRLDLRTGRISGMEALIRWQHPELGLVPPMRFIGVAEETGMIVEIGNWVLRTACAQNKAWQMAGLPALHVAVNVSARQFRKSHFADDVVKALADSGLDAKYLELELTESLMMQDVDEAVATLVTLKELGVALSIDDFGTGYSSLSYLRRFPIDYLKIDQSFIRDMLSDPNGAAIVRSIISLGHNLNFKVIAEGVETEAQLAYLERDDCDEMQGYFFSRPVPAEAFTIMLEKGASLQRSYPAAVA